MSILETFKLDGKVALVTGCRRGIGKALAEGLAEAGADIIGVSSSLEESGSDIERSIRSIGQEFSGFNADLNNREDLYKFINKVKTNFPIIDILVNNAGLTLRAPAAEHPDDYWDTVINVNLNSPFVLSREIGRDMIARGKGKILFTASVLSFQGGITVPSYSASKGAIAQLTSALANEWASQGVNVNAIAPGYIMTDLTSALQTDPVRSQAISDRIPAERWGIPEDLKGAAVYLCSDASNYVNGSIITVDGGWMGR
tara:strand:- start:97257 stop:98027 length:771 start_codon:yes stop_codon:yes gene_type:complete